MASALATTHAATTAIPLGRVAVARAAANPASSQRSSRSRIRHVAANTISSASEYANDRIALPGKIA
jgi:hypothetical protein